MCSKVTKNFIILILAALLSVNTAFPALAQGKEVSVKSGRTIVVLKTQFFDKDAEIVIMRDEKKFTPAPGVRILEGDRIYVGKDAVIYLVVDSQAVLYLDSKSEAVIRKATFRERLVVKAECGHMYYTHEQTARDSFHDLMENNIGISINM